MLLAAATAKSQGPVTAAASSKPGSCDALPHPDHPRVRLTNGRLVAEVYLPDDQHGYYRGPRFDWSGIVGCASLNGHTFFGELVLAAMTPLITDAVTGPAEEFRHPTSELGYDEALPGGQFLKIGVGVLQRIDDAPYSFFRAYPIVDHGTWKVKVHGPFGHLHPRASFKDRLRVQI